MSKKYAYSETFYSIQGEGKYTGHPTLWLRYFLCNLQCDGFGQKNPKDPSTYVLPYKDFDVTSVKKIEDMPVFTHGCDSSYSWSNKFKHLQYKGTPSEIYQELMGRLPKKMIIQPSHMCFTGGEPLLKHAQECTIALLDEFIKNKYPLSYVTHETNGTQKLSDDFINSMYHLTTKGVQTIFSISPKLHSVSGEKNAIDLDIIESYYRVSYFDMYLKFVSNGTTEAWEEIDYWVGKIKERKLDIPVWIMPVGATIEGQKNGIYSDGEIASQALERGYNVSARVHVYLWGNKIGV